MSWSDSAVFGIVGKSKSLDFPTMLIFWSLVRNSVVLAVYLLFSVACFLTVHEHSCLELSKQVHLSVSKLTKGFVNLFGTPVHSYIINQRLERAAQLLIETEMTVGQVAILVGYSKPSNCS